MKLVKKRMNPQLEVGGVIVTQYDNRLLLHKEVLQSLQAAFPGKVFKTTIRNSVALAEAPSYGQDIFQYKPSCKAAEQYKTLVGELLERE